MNLEQQRLMSMRPADGALASLRRNFQQPLGHDNLIRRMNHDLYNLRNLTDRRRWRAFIPYKSEIYNQSNQPTLYFLFLKANVTF